MVVKDVDSFMTCGAVLAQMPKGEKHLPIPCNAGLSSRSHCSQFQTKRGHFLFVSLRCMHVYAAYFPNHFERE